MGLQNSTRTAAAANPFAMNYVAFIPAMRPSRLANMPLPNLQRGDIDMHRNMCVQPLSPSTTAQQCQITQLSVQATLHCEIIMLHGVCCRQHNSSNRLSQPVLLVHACICRQKSQSKFVPRTNLLYFCATGGLLLLATIAAN